MLEPRDGGVAENVLLLGEGLRRLGHDVDVAGPAGAAMYPRLAAAGIRIHVISDLSPGFGRPRADARAFVRVLRLLRRGGYDVVHCHSAKAGVVGRLAAGMVRVPAVFSPHSFSFVGEFSERRRRFAVAVERCLAPLTTELICACHAEYDLAREQRIRCPTTVIHYGVESPDQAVPVSEEVARFGDGALLVASLAALRPQKTLEVLLEAAPEILRRVDRARIAVIGNGPEREVLHARARELGLTDSERFGFFAFRGPSGRYLPLIQVFVLPSAWEALPIGVLEAQAYGVPQVATDVGGTREAVDDHVGALVPPHDPRAVTAAVVGLLQDGERRSLLAQASRARHAEHFTVARMVAETAAVYARAAAPRRA